MALCTEVFWIRLNLSAFEDPRWLVIEQLPEADAIENIYIRLLILAGKSNTNGLLLIFDRVPYTIDTLSAVLRHRKSVVEFSLNVLIKFGFVELLDDVYAVLDWDRLQFSDDLAKIAERREKDKIRQREKRKAQKLLSMDASSDISPDSLAISKATETDDKIELENNNKSAVTFELAKALLQKKWQLLSTSEAAIQAVAMALATDGEDYVSDNIKYVQDKAKDNPVKYLTDGLTRDYAGHRQKAAQNACLAVKRELQQEIDKHKREEEDKEIRRWYVSAEGQAEVKRLRDLGLTFPRIVPTHE